MKDTFAVSLRHFWLLVFYVCILWCSMEPSLVEALFEDQAFKFDWRQQYIGKSEKLVVWQDTSSTRSDLILSVTKSNVLAAVFSDSGKLK